jgi:hypothetical protein
VSAWVRENLVERHPEFTLSSADKFYDEQTRSAVAAGTMTAIEADRTVAFGEWAREIADQAIQTRPVYFLQPSGVRLRDSYYITPRGMLYRLELRYQAPAASWFDTVWGLPHTPSTDPRPTLITDLQYKYNEAQHEAATGALRCCVNGAVAMLRQGDVDSAAELVRRAQTLLEQIRGWGRIPYQHPDGRGVTDALTQVRATATERGAGEVPAALWAYLGHTPKVGVGMLLLVEWADAEAGRIRPPDNARVTAGVVALIERGVLTRLDNELIAEFTDRQMGNRRSAGETDEDDLARRERVVDGVRTIVSMSPIVFYHLAGIAWGRAVLTGQGSPAAGQHIEGARMLMERAAHGFDAEVSGAPDAYMPKYRRAMAWAQLFVLDGEEETRMRANVMLSNLLKFPESRKHASQIQRMMSQVAGPIQPSGMPR